MLLELTTTTESVSSEVSGKHEIGLLFCPPSPSEMGKEYRFIKRGCSRTEIIIVLS